jgi:hypothetical protein
MRSYVKKDKNPGGAPISVFDDLRAQLAANRAQFYKDITLPFCGYNRPGAKISEGIRGHWWLQAMMGGMKGDDDQTVSIGAAAPEARFYCERGAAPLGER